MPRISPTEILLLKTAIKANREHLNERRRLLKEAEARVKHHLELLNEGKAIAYQMGVNLDD